MLYKQALIIANTYKEESLVLADLISVFLHNRSVISSVALFDTAICSCSFTDCDFVITLGGDGTVLFAARGCVEHEIPVFAVNLGQFGFIAGVQKDAWQEDLERFLSGEMPLVRRAMLCASVFRNGKCISNCLALNDIVISSGAGVGIISVDVRYNDIPFGLFKADGVIAATSTGSTAYSAAAGGPIVDPCLDAIILNPICPFSLSNRSLVLPASGRLGLKILASRAAEVNITADGQINRSLETDDLIQIDTYHKKVMLAGCTQDKFFGALKSKLHWSGGIHA